MTEAQGDTVIALLTNIDANLTALIALITTLSNGQTFALVTAGGPANLRVEHSMTMGEFAVATALTFHLVLVVFKMVFNAFRGVAL